MNDHNFVYGDETRIFVNTDMGCSAKCKYCYLPSLKIHHGERKISAARAIELVNNLGCYICGEKGSVISIGCYSECMDKDNVADTIELVKFFAQNQNNVQLATKKKVESYFFEEIIRCNKGILDYLWLYVSLPTIACHDWIELGTDIPEERMKTFELCKEYNVRGILYIKPYLKAITMKDVTYYNELICKYNIPAVVVGEMLDTMPTLKKTMVGEGALYEQSENDIEKFIDQISCHTKVYRHSVDCIKFQIMKGNA